MRDLEILLFSNYGKNFCRWLFVNKNFVGAGSDTLIAAFDGLGLSICRPTMEKLRSVRKQMDEKLVMAYSAFSSL